MLKSRVSFGDWAMLVITVLFCAGALFILPRDPRVGTGCLLMFAPCALLAIERIRSKRRRASFNATLVAAPGGVELCMSKTRFMLFGLLAIGPGLSVFFYENTPIWVLLAGGTFLLAGAGMMATAASGVLARRYLRFDPEGLTLGEWSYSFRVDWDNFADLAEFEYASNDCIGFNIVDPERVRVLPETRRPRFIKRAGRNAGWLGRDVVLMPTHFAVDAASLALALARYASDASARAELTPRPALPQQA